MLRNRKFTAGADMYKFIRCGVFILFFLLLLNAFSWADGVAFTWTAGGDGVSWTQAANWSGVGGSGSTYPDEDGSGTDTANFSPGAALTLTPQAGCTLAGLTVGANGTLTPAGAFTVTGAATCNGTITAAAAGISFGGNLTGSGTLNASGGNTTFSAGLGITTYVHNSGTAVFDNPACIVAFDYTFYDINITGTLRTNDCNIIALRDIYGTGTLLAEAGGVPEVITVARHFTVAAFTAEDSSVVFNNNTAADVSAHTFYNLTLSKTGGSVTFTGNTSVTNTMTVNAGAYNVSFTGGTNNFTTPTVTFNNTGALTLGNGGDNFTFSGGLTATAPGTLTLNGNIGTADTPMSLGNAGLGGATSITTGGGTLSLGTVNNAQTLSVTTTGGTGTGAITFGGAIGGGTPLTGLTVNSKAALGLPAVTVTGNLVVESGAGITQTAALGVGGNADFTAPGGASIILGEANTFSGTVSFLSPGTLAAVTVRDTTALDLEALTLTGNLSVTSGGNITQSGVLNIGGTSDFTLNSGTTDITLGSGNTFANTITFTNNGNIRDLSFRKAAGAAAFPALPAGLRNLTVVWNTGFVLPSGSFTGIMSLSAGGAVTQAAGGIQAASLLLLGTGPYTLTEAANDVDTLAVNTTEAVSFRDTDDLIVETVLTTNGITTTGDNVTLQTGGTLAFNQAVALGTGNLTLNSNGNVSQTAAITAAGLELIGGGTATFTLANIGNDFTTVAANTVGLVSIRDTNDLIVGTVGVTTGVSTSNAAITLRSGGFLTLNAAVSSNTGVGDITLRPATTLDINAPVTAGTGNIILRAGGAANQTAALSAAGLQIRDVGPYNLILATNDVNTLAVNTTAAVSFRDANNLIVETVLAINGITTTGNNVTLRTGGTLDINQAVALAAGNLTLNAGGAVNQTAAISGAGLELLGTGPYNLAGVVTNNFTTLAANTTGNITYRDSAALALGTVNTNGLSTTGDVLITTGGNLTDDNGTTIAVTGSATLNAGANNITLGDNAGDTTNFGSLIITGGAVTIIEDSASVLASVNAASLAITSFGAITGTGTLTVTGAASFITRADGGANITLNDPGNTFGSLTLRTLNTAGGASAAGVISVYENAAMDLALVNTTSNAEFVGILGNMTDSGTVTIGGTASFTTQQANAVIDLGTLSVTGAVSVTTFGAAGNAALVNGIALNLGASNVGGTLSARAAAGITVSGAVVSGGIATLRGNTMTLSGTLAAGAGASNVYLLPDTDGTAVSIGGAAGFNLTQAELTSITASTIVVGQDSVPARTAGAVTTCASGAVNIGARNLTLSGTGITAGGNTLTTTGSIYLISTGGVQGNAGALTDFAAGSIQINSVSGAGSATQLQTDTPALTVSNTGTNAVSVSNAQSLNIGGTSSITNGAAAGAVTLVVTGGTSDITISNTLSGTGAAAITLTAGRHILFAQGAGVNGISTTGSISLNASSQIQGNANNATDCNAPTINLTAAAGIGLTHAIQTAGQVLDADTTGAAAHIFITNVSAAAAQLVSFSTTGAGANITVNHSGGGALTAASVTTGNGTIEINGTASAIIAQGLTAGNSNAITVATVTTGNITLGALDAAGSTITITSAGSINDAAVDTVVDLTAAAVVLTAAAGIGNTAPIETAATSITADVNGNFALDITNSNANPVTINRLTTDGGAISFSQTGGGLLTLGAGGIDKGGVANANPINVTSTGGLTVNGVVSSLGGTGGTLSIDGLTLNVTPTVGQGNITLSGGGQDLDLSAPLTIAASLTLFAPRDIYINAAVFASGAASDLTLTADNNDNGVGGVLITLSGQARAGRNVSIYGSDLFVTGAALDSIMVEADGANNQIEAGGNILLEHRPSAPAGSYIEINGVVASTGGGNIVLNGLDGIFLASSFADITTNGGNITANADTDSNNTGNWIQLDAGSTLSSSGGAVSVTAADISIIGTINSGAGDITLAPSTAGRSIGINNAAGDFSLTAAELILLTSTGTVTVGRTDGTGAIGIGSSGAINLSARTYSLTIEGNASALTMAAATLTLPDNRILTLSNGGAITAAGGATHVVIGGVTGTIAVPQAVSVGTLANPLTVSAARLGGAALSGGLYLTAVAPLSVTAAVATAGNPVVINAGANAFSNTAAGTINAGASTVSLTSNTIDLAGTVTANGGITLLPDAVGTTIGLNNGAGTFNLTTAELVLLASTGTVTVGRTDGTGAIGIGSSGAINLAGEAYDLTIRGTSSNVSFNFGAMVSTLSLPANATFLFDVGTGTVTTNGTAVSDITIGGTGLLRFVSAGAVGAAGTPLSASVASLGQSTVAGAFYFRNNSDLTVTGILTSEEADIDTGTNSLTLSASLDAGIGNLVLTADTLAVGAEIQTAGALTLQPFSAGRLVSIGATGAQFDLDDTEIAFLRNGFSSITVGRTTAGAVTVTTASFQDPVTILGGTAGAVTLSTLSTTDGAGITVTSTSGNIVVNGPVAADGTGTVALTAGTAGNIQIGANISSISNGTITLNAGGGISRTAGTVGAASSGSLVVLTAAAGNIGASGSEVFTDAAILRASATGNIFISEADTLQLGDAGVGNDVTSSGGGINIAAGGAISTGNTVSTTGGNGSIVLTTVSGGITIGHGISADGSGAVDMDSAGGFTLNSPITMQSVTGNISVSTTGANPLNINGSVITGGAGTVTLSGSNAVTLDNNSLVRTQNGTIEITSAAGNITVFIVESTGNAQITLSSAGAVLEVNDSARLGAAGSTSILDITAATAVGAAGAGALNTDVGTLRVSAGGAVYINEANALQLGDAGAGNDVTSAGGTITVTAAGNITTGNTVSTTGGAGSGIALTTTAGGTITISNAFTTVAAGAVTITNAGQLSTTALISPGSGGFTQNGAGTVLLGANIVTRGGAINFLRAVLLSAGITLDTTNAGGVAAGAGITFQNTLGAQTAGTQSLTLNGGTGGTITFAEAVGNTGANRLNVLTLTNAGTVNVNSTLYAVSISQAACGGATTFGGAVNTSGAAGIDFNGAIYNINAAVTTTGTGPVTITNGGLLTLAAAAVMNLDGAFSQDGTAATVTAADITTTNDNISFLRAVTLSGNISLDTDTGAGNVTFSAALSGQGGGGQTLDITAGTGSVTFTGAVGSAALGAVTITDASGGVTANNTITAGSMTITNGGAVDLNGTVTVLSGFSSNGTTFDNTGATISATDTPITINHTGNVTIGAALSSGNGNVDIDATGAGSTVSLNQTVTTSTGNVTVDSNAGTTIIAAGTITTTTGNVTFGGTLAGTLTTAGNVSTTGNGGDVTFARAVTLSGNITVNTGAAAGDITFQQTINGTAAETLTLTAGTGDVTVSGITGGTSALGSLGITGHIVTLTGIGNAGAGVTGAVNVTSSGAGGYIDLLGQHYRSGNNQTYTASAAGVEGVRMRTTGAGQWTAGAGTVSLPGTVLYLDAPGAAITLGTNLSCGSFIFYRGTLNLNGRTITTAGDFAAFGTGYDPNDPDRNTTQPANILFRYPAAAGLLYYPAGGTYNAGTALFSTAPGAAFGPMAGAGLTVGGNFYVNGSDMLGAAAWSLTVPANAASNPVGNPAAFSWGTPYAVALNMEVSNSAASGGWINAAAGLPAGPGPYGTEHNNGVQNSGGNSNWQFYRPQLRAAETVYDDMIRVTFEDNDGNLMLIENSGGEISAAVGMAAGAAANGSFWYSGGTVKFAGAFGTAEGAALTNTDVDTFYIRTNTAVAAARWNTDANGTSAGDAGSTDRGRPGVPPAHRTNIPDLTFLKGMLFAAEGKTMAVNYGLNGEALFDGTTDECRPVLVGVTAGKAPHQRAVADLLKEPYDAHNYLHLRYSEPVNIGTAAGMTAAETSGGTGAENLRAQTGFAAADEWGAHILQNGASVEVSGYLLYPGTFESGSRSGGPAVTSLYRGSAGGENPAVSHGITLFVLGYSYMEGARRYWPGYMWNVSNPLTANITVPANSYITDLLGNQIEPTSAPYAKAVISISDGIANVAPAGVAAAPMPAGHTGGWDTDPPGFSTYLNDDPKILEVVSLESPTTGLINRLEMFFHDNYDEQDLSTGGLWDAYNDSGAHAALDSSQIGIRDTSWEYHDWVPPEYLAFYIEQEGITPRINTFNIDYDSYVNNSLFGEKDASDDPYMTLLIQATGHPWTQLVPLWFNYVREEAFITDLAGNLLPSTDADAIPLMIEKVPPKIQLTLAVDGDNKVYVRFNEPVAGNLEKTQPITPSSFVLNNPTYSIVSIETIGEDPVLCTDAFIYLNQALNPNILVSLRVASQPDSVFDRVGNKMDTSYHRITDIGLGVVEPVWASDGIHGGISGDEPGRSALHDFDGTGRLLPRDIVIQAVILASNFASYPLSLFYDSNPPANTFVSTEVLETVNPFWLPHYYTGFNPRANTEARSQLPYSSQGNLRNFLIPGSDPDIAEGNILEFIFRLGDLYCARVTDITDPRSLAPWSFNFESLKEQRAGVTIVNNVINPLQGERTVLTYALTKAGMATVQVFALDGSLVRILHRGRQGTGTYTFVWDGRNNAGNVVARGMYFIRVVAPGIDEYRKVMVIK